MLHAGYAVQGSAVRYVYLLEGPNIYVQHASSSGLSHPNFVLAGELLTKCKLLRPTFSLKDINVVRRKASPPRKNTIITPYEISSSLVRR